MMETPYQTEGGVLKCSQEFADMVNRHIAFGDVHFLALDARTNGYNATALTDKGWRKKTLSGLWEFQLKSIRPSAKSKVLLTFTVFNAPGTHGIKEVEIYYEDIHKFLIRDSANIICRLIEQTKKDIKISMTTPPPEPTRIPSFETIEGWGEW